MVVHESLQVVPSGGKAKGDVGPQLIDAQH